MRYSVKIEVSKSLKGFIPLPLSEDDARSVAVTVAEDNDKRLVDYVYNEEMGTVTALIENTAMTESDAKAALAVFSPNAENPTMVDGLVKEAAWPLIGFVVVSGIVLSGLIIINWTVVEIKELASETREFFRSEIGVTILGGIAVFFALSIIKELRR